MFVKDPHAKYYFSPSIDCRQRHSKLTWSIQLLIRYNYVEREKLTKYNGISKWIKSRVEVTKSLLLNGKIVCFSSWYKTQLRDSELTYPN